MSEAYDFIVIGAGISGSCDRLPAGQAGTQRWSSSTASRRPRWRPAGRLPACASPAGIRRNCRWRRAAVELWSTLDDDLGARTHYTRKGNLRLARDEGEYGQIRRMVDEQSAEGLDLTFLPDNAALREIAPALSRDIPGASFCPSDGHADPHATVAAFVGAAKRHGAVFRNHERVTEIRVEGGRVKGVATDRGTYSAPRVILAAGFLGRELLAPLGIDVPIDVRMVTVVRSVPVDPVLDQVIGVAGGDWAGRQEVDGRFRVTSGGQPWHNEMSVSDGGRGPRPVVRPPMATLSEVVQQMERLLPGSTAHPIEDVWAGLIDMTPDALPVLDMAPGVDGLVLGMGFSGHGFCLGPITGQGACGSGAWRGDGLRSLRLRGTPLRCGLAACRRRR